MGFGQLATRWPHSPHLKHGPTILGRGVLVVVVWLFAGTLEASDTGAVSAAPLMLAFLLAAADPPARYLFVTLSAFLYIRFSSSESDASSSFSYAVMTAQPNSDLSAILMCFWLTSMAFIPASR